MEQSDLEEFKTYKIFHNYDVGDSSVYVSSKSNPLREALYCQYKGEEWFGETITITNLAIANALVSLYSCWHIKSSDTAIEIDMYYEREGISLEEYKSVMNDKSIERDDLEKLLAYHVPDSCKN